MVHFLRRSLRALFFVTIRFFRPTKTEPSNNDKSWKKEAAIAVRVVASLHSKNQKPNKRTISLRKTRHSQSKSQHPSETSPRTQNSEDTSRKKKIMTMATSISSSKILSTLAVCTLWFFSDVDTVQSFTTPVAQLSPPDRGTVLRQSSIAVDAPTTSSSSSSSSMDISKMRSREIQSELKQLKVSFHDCFDKESLIQRLVEARRQAAPGTSIRPNVYEPAPSVTTTTASVSQTTIDVESTTTELRSKSLKELKLECSKRGMRYATFREKDDFVNAIVDNMKSSLRFSATGLLRPGTVTDVTGDQLDVEIASQQQNDQHVTPILVDCYATWCGPCKMVVPQLEAAAKQFGSNVRVVKIDSDKNPSFARRYQVQGLPTMMLFKDGRLVDRLEGAHMTDAIVTLVKKHLSL